MSNGTKSVDKLRWEGNNIASVIVYPGLRVGDGQTIRVLVGQSFAEVRKTRHSESVRNILFVSHGRCPSQMRYIYLANLVNFKRQHYYLMDEIINETSNLKRQ